jgi:aromatic ring-cleaving dioxygenase
MTEKTHSRPRNIFLSYHAHVYFDHRTVEQARDVCQNAAKRFGVLMGRMHQKPVGPHPRWSCQLSFDSKQFDTLIPWLEQNRGGLTVLVHGVTGHDLEDHTTHASWLGEPVELNLEVFR